MSAVMSRHRKTGVNVLNTTLKDMRHQLHNYLRCNIFLLEITVHKCTEISSANFNEIYTGQWTSTKTNGQTFFALL